MKKSRTQKTRTSRTQLFEFQTLEDRKLMATLTGAGDIQSEDFALPALIQSANQVQDNDHGPAQRIVNGEQTDGWEAVGYVGPLGCTGTLISPTHVLTAAHCLEGVSNSGAFFEVNGQTYNSSKVTIHENYNANQFDAGYDLAIIELDRAVNGVEPMNINRTTPQVGTMLTLVGFGEGGTSQGGYDPNDTGKQVGQTELEEVSQTHISWNFDSHNESNTAPGDSGGPAFVEVNGEFLIAGVTSGGDGDAHTLGDYSFDTRIDNLADWIDNQVGNDDGPDQGGDDHSDSPNADATRIKLTNGVGSATGNLESTGDRDAFKFTINEDGETTISLNAANGSEVDTYLRIYDTDGNLIHENDDAGGDLDSEVVANLTAGRYFATAGAYDDSGTGAYEISVEHQADAGGDGDHDTFSNDNSMEISDVGRDRVVSTINVSGMTGSIADLNVEVDIQHTYNSDLRLVLVAPDRTRIILVNRQGGSENNFEQTLFDQQASKHINRGDAPFRGSYRPAQSLDQLNGLNPNGRWRLVVIDMVDQDGGSLDSWTLEIDTDAARNKRSVDLTGNLATDRGSNPTSNTSNDHARRRRFRSIQRQNLGLASSIQHSENSGESRSFSETENPQSRTRVLDSVFESSAFEGLFD
jgi:subtilisin-like proprotein convertase family protein/V8-like Glu-specific endopeptidase